jgi:hypothetical protein
MWVAWVGPLCQEMEPSAAPTAQAPLWPVVAIRALPLHAPVAQAGLVVGEGMLGLRAWAQESRTVAICMTVARVTLLSLVLRGLAALVMWVAWVGPLCQEVEPRAAPSAQARTPTPQPPA